MPLKNKRVSLQLRYVIRHKNLDVGVGKALDLKDE